MLNVCLSPVKSNTNINRGADSTEVAMY